MRVAMLGLGLIGGSIARSLRAAPDSASWSVIAWSERGAGPAAAARAGVIEDAAVKPEAAIDGADLVVLAAPAPACLAMLTSIAGPWKAALASDAVVTDVASTKGAITDRAAELGIRFVGGHPMAGRDASGFEAATPDLFVDRPWVIVPSSDADAVARVETLALACGARPIRMAADAHDVAVAGISHLPLIAAVALVEAVAGQGSRDDDGWPAAAALAASGWRDTTRLARGDVAMGTGIAVTNGPALAARIRDLVAVLETWADLLEGTGHPGADAIEARLTAARARLAAMDR